MLKNKERLILITNDDGYWASGLNALIEVIKPYGRVVVVAPEKGESGKSHSITMSLPIRLKRISEEKNITLYSCTGTPVDCVKLALNQVVEQKPAMVVSGFNHGSNSSISVIYSGTMGAVIEACFNGIPSIGFSLLDYQEFPDFSASQKIAINIIEKVLAHGLPTNVCLNVNIPKLPFSKIKGIKLARQAMGIWKEEFEKRIDPSQQPYYWMTGDFHNNEPNATDTDEWALTHGYASVVPIHTDLTAYHAFKHFTSWHYE